ncbi:MAG: GTP 3',8-cyclase MoaA [Candidatus Omnitrophica bacterium]|nr:GTP 3',8-cyclase MoaA [Candidatus Omnitrophota bacterium]
MTNLNCESPLIAPKEQPRNLRIYDSFDRPLRDLRISVIDQCNFRCVYCMPQNQRIEHYTFLKQDQWLTFPQIERLARLFVKLGVGKIRITGGEPLLRPNLSNLVGKLKGIPEVKDLALTTNGSMLIQHAQALKDAGLDRITVSLDTLDPALFRQINGFRGTLEKVLDGIQLCQKIGFGCIKINVVLQKNIGHRHILDLVRYFKGRKPILRFIEYMDAGNCNHWSPDAVVPASEIVKLIHEHFPLRAVRSNYYGEVASRYEFLDGEGEIGFITPITQPFCRTCTRARVSADGKMYPCLFANHGTDLRPFLRQDIPDDVLLNIIQSDWRNRKDRYSELRAKSLSSQKSLPKIEMFQIGG